jgi:hypothetical protein
MNMSVSSSGTNNWSSMSASRASRQQEMFNKVDSDGSGSVSKTELQSMLDDMAKRTGTASTTSAEDSFSKMDSNADGSLDASELDEGMKSLMPPPSTMAFARSRHGGGEGGPEGAAGEVKDAILSMLKAADTDGDQAISSSEFEQFKDVLSTVANDMTPSEASSSTPQQGSDSGQAFNLSSLADMVLQAYAKAAGNASAQEGVGSLVSVAA